MWFHEVTAILGGTYYVSGTVHRLYSPHLMYTTTKGEDPHCHLQVRRQAEETQGLLGCAQGQPQVSGSDGLWQALAGPRGSDGRALLVQTLSPTTVQGLFLHF